MSKWIRGRLGRPLASILSVLMLASLLMPLAPPPVQAQGEQGAIDWAYLTAGPKAGPVPLIVLDFNYRSANSTGDLGHDMSDSLSLALADTGKFSVVSRQKTESAMHELGVNVPMDYNAQAMLADHLDTPYTVSGTIDSVTIHHGKDGTYAEVVADAVVINRVTRLPINGAHVIQRSSPKVGYVSNTDALVYEAITSAAYQISQTILDNRIPVSTVLLSDGDNIKIRGGLLTGLADGMTLIAIRQESVTGLMRITQINAGDANCKVIDSRRGIAPGDRVVPLYSAFNKSAAPAIHAKAIAALTSVVGLGLLAALMGRATNENNTQTPTAVSVADAGERGDTNGSIWVHWSPFGNANDVVAYIIYRVQNNNELPIAMVRGDITDFVDIGASNILTTTTNTTTGTVNSTTGTGSTTTGSTTINGTTTITTVPLTPSYFTDLVEITGLGAGDTTAYGWQPLYQFGAPSTTAGTTGTGTTGTGTTGTGTTGTGTTGTGTTGTGTTGTGTTGTGTTGTGTTGTGTTGTGTTGTGTITSNYYVDGQGSAAIYAACEVLPMNNMTGPLSYRVQSVYVSSLIAGGSGTGTGTTGTGTTGTGTTGTGTTGTGTTGTGTTGTGTTGTGTVGTVGNTTGSLSRAAHTRANQGVVVAGGEEFVLEISDLSQMSNMVSFIQPESLTTPDTLTTNEGNIDGVFTSSAANFVANRSDQYVFQFSSSRNFPANETITEPGQIIETSGLFQAQYQSTDLTTMISTISTNTDFSGALWVRVGCKSSIDALAPMGYNYKNVNGYVFSLPNSFVIPGTLSMRARILSHQLTAGGTPEIRSHGTTQRLPSSGKK